MPVRYSLDAGLAAGDGHGCGRASACGLRMSRTNLVDELEPDLLFLDVKLPELTGLDVVERIRHRPALVFTTAHDRFAVAAFERGALDYRLKPFGPERFGQMLERVRAHLAAPAAPDAVERTRLALSAAPVRRNLDFLEQITHDQGFVRRYFVSTAFASCPSGVTL